MKPLLIPLRTAGAVLGLVSEQASREHVPKLFQIVTTGAKKQCVLASQLAQYLKVDLAALWATIDSINERDREAAPATAAKAARDKAAIEKERLAQIEKQVDTMPAVVQAKKAGVL